MCMDNIININNPNSYRLTGKYIQGCNILALEITGNNGVIKVVKIEDIYKLVEKNLIFGCKILEDNGTKHLLSTGDKISSLPLIRLDNIKIMKITGRVYKNESLIGYTVTDEDGKMLNLSKDKVWELTKNGNISNARVYISNNKKIICGDGEHLKDLPVIKI